MRCVFLIAVYASGHYSAHNPLNDMLFISLRALLEKRLFLSFFIRESLMSAASSRSPHLTQATKAFVDAITAENNPPLYTLPPQAARRILADAQAKPIKKLVMDMHDEDLPVGPTGKVPTRFIRPEGAGGKLPIVFYFHGGGWILGDKDTHDRLVRELAKGAQAAVVYPNYTPSPEAQYPVPLEQAYAAMLHVIEHADAYGLDSSRIAVAGDSVGGNMATVMTLLAKERKGPEIAFQLLLYPVTDANFDTESYHDFADGPWLTREAMKWFWDAYAPDARRRGEPTASPLRATTEQLAGLPPAMIITAENDVLRDEGEAYARRLIDAGVHVACVRYNNTHHDFMMLNALAETTPTRAAIAQAAAALKKMLH